VTRPLLVERRDRQLVEWDSERIRRAVERAQEAVADEDPTFAREVADLVGLALRAHGPVRPSSDTLEVEPGGPVVVGVEDVQDLVEKALIEMGRAHVARAYIVYRDRRARAREGLEVHFEASDGASSVSSDVAAPAVADGGRVRAWSKAHVAARLAEESDLPLELAEEVAERVERRVLGAGFRRLTTSLIREIVDNEAVAMGFGAAITGKEALVLPRVLVGRLLEAEAPTEPAPEPPAEDRPGPTSAQARAVRLSADPREALARHVFERYAREELLAPEANEASRDGLLAFEELARPLDPLVRCLPAELLGGVHPTFESGSHLVARLAPLARRTVHSVVIEELGPALARALRRRGGRGELYLREIARSLCAVARAAGCRIELSRLDPAGARDPHLLPLFLPVLAELAAEGEDVPRLWLTWAELEAALDEDPTQREAATRLTQLGAITPVWAQGGPGSGLRWVAPGCRRGTHELGAIACAGAASVNLPRLARRAGPWREDAFLSEVHRALVSAARGLASLQQFQASRGRRAPEAPRERIGSALVPVGLGEALAIVGDGVARPEQGARLLGLFDDAARRLGIEEGIALCVSPCFGQRAAVRFASMDAARGEGRQERLFDELPTPEHTGRRPYRLGFDLPAGFFEPAASGSGESGAAALTSLFSTLESGALVPFQVADPLTLWEAFERRRAEARGRVLIPASPAGVSTPSGPPSSATSSPGSSSSGSDPVSQPRAVSSPDRRPGPGPLFRSAR